jgi:hypothetical protein
MRSLFSMWARIGPTPRGKVKRTVLCWHRGKKAAYLDSAVGLAVGLKTELDDGR